MAVKTVARFFAGGRDSSYQYTHYLNLGRPPTYLQDWVFACKGVGGFVFVTQCPTIRRSRHHSARGEARDTISGRRHQTCTRATLTRFFAPGMASDHRPRCGERLRAYIQLNAAHRAALDSKKYIRKSSEAGRSKRHFVFAGNRQRASNMGRAHKLLTRCRALDMCAYGWEAARGRCGRSWGKIGGRRLSRPIFD